MTSLGVASCHALILMLAASSWCLGADADGLRQHGLTVTEKDGTITAVSGPMKGLVEADLAIISGAHGVTSLNLGGAPGMLTDQFIERLAGLTDLQDLAFNSAEVSDEGVRRLAGFPHLRSLTLFHPSRGRADFTGAGFAALSGLADLERMTVAGGTVGDAALQAIATLPHLRELRLWHNSETAAGVKCLAGLMALRKLTLGQRLPGRDPKPASLSDESLPALAGIQTLEELSIQDAHLSLEALTTLTRLPHLKKITASQIDTPAADVEKLRALLPRVTIDWKPMTEQEAATMRDKLKL